MRIRYVPDLYLKEKEQSLQYLKERHMVGDEHAGADDTSEIMFIDAAHKWIRTEKLAASDRAHEPQTGVVGDPTKANAAMGKVFIDLKVSDAVAQIRAYRQPKL